MGNNFHKTTFLNKHLNKHLLNKERNLLNYLEILNAFWPKISNLPEFKRDENSKAKVEGKRWYLHFRHWHWDFLHPSRLSSFWALIKQNLNIMVWGDTKRGFDLIWEQMDITYIITSMHFSGRHFPNSSTLQCWKEDAEPGSEYEGFYWALLKLVIYDTSL